MHVCVHVGMSLCVHVYAHTKSSTKLYHNVGKLSRNVRVKKLVGKYTTDDYVIQTCKTSITHNWPFVTNRLTK